MPKNKFQDVIFTLIMATIMVYGMVVYNVALNTGGVTGQTAVHYLCDFHLYLLYYVSVDESGCNDSVQGYKVVWNMGTDMGNELPDGNLLPDVLLRTTCKTAL